MQFILKISFAGIFLVPNLLIAQSVNAPLNQDYYHLIDRFEIKQGKFAPSYHATVKPYTRSGIVQLLDSVNQEQLSRQDAFNFEYLRRDNWEYADKNDSTSYALDKPVFNIFFKNPADFVRIRSKNFDLQINPVLNLGAGLESANSSRLFTNTRGVEARGMIDDKIGFYTFIGENQVLFAQHVRAYRSQYRVIPNEGFFKNFKDRGAVDFFTVRGYISFQATKSINLQFGHDRFFLGNGNRSLMLSDHAANYLFLKAQTKVWKFNYTNLLAQMTADNRTTAGGQLIGVGNSYPQKFMASHHLSYNITKNLNIGIFETVVFGDPDQQTFDINYLNPIIFYRAIEHQDGSSGNALVGADFRWLLFNRFSLYGQFMLDEFKLGEIRAQSGWWANKYALQGGLKYIDVLGINNLDLQLEYNYVRPFMYSHLDNFTNYTNYRQSLAHPLGANFKEQLAVVRYQPVSRLQATATLALAEYGTDSLGLNMGQNILQPYDDRFRDYGNFTGQGISNQLLFIDFQLSYMLFHNIFVDLRLADRRQKIDFDGMEDVNNRFFTIGMRWNLPKRTNIF